MEKSIGAYEAKTHLPRLLKEVSAGYTITITKHGVPIAKLIPADRPDVDPKEAVKRLQETVRKIQPQMRGLNIRDLIDEGRKY